ncbi:MAG TPA: hypothetical protein VJ110_00865 [Candidatus Nanoarchaeia archaeon]|nr:hypothetical protein [Candidatus Nanoarchaeia archaeon]
MFEKLSPHKYTIGIAAGYTAILAANVADPVMLPATIIGGLTGGLLVIGYLGYKHRKPAAKAITATEESLETKLEMPINISSGQATPLEQPEQHVKLGIPNLQTNTAPSPASYAPSQKPAENSKLKLDIPNLTSPK